MVRSSALVSARTRVQTAARPRSQGSGRPARPTVEAVRQRLCDLCRVTPLRSLPVPRAGTATDRLASAPPPAAARARMAAASATGIVGQLGLHSGGHHARRIRQDDRPFPVGRQRSSAVRVATGRRGRRRPGALPRLPCGRSARRHRHRSDGVELAAARTTARDRAHPAGTLRGRERRGTVRPRHRRHAPDHQ